MAKIRVHELAKEIGMPSKEMVDTLQRLGLDIKNHMSTMEESQASWVKKRLGEKKEPAPQSGRPFIQDQRPDAEPRKGPATSSSRAQQDRVINNTFRPQSGIKPATQSGRPDTTARRQGPSPNSSGVQAIQPPEFEKRGNQGFRQPRTTGSSDINKPAEVRTDAGRRTTGNRDNRPNAARSGSDSRPASSADSRPGTPRTGSDPRTTNNKDNRHNSPRPGQPGNISRPSTTTGFINSGFDNKKKPGVNTQGKPPKKTVPAKPQFTKDYSRPQKKGKHKKKKEEANLVTPDFITVGDSLQVRELAERLAKGSAEIVKKLMELGIMATINQEIDFETIEIVASLYDVEVRHEESAEQKILEEIVDTAESLLPRSPIITVMGHVDHGKTSLLDRIRKADVVSGEAGGITQHIGAYQVKVNDNRITFIDTPGHAAFTAMRARGANLTDIVILVVAADDGVMPQTIEAINHIKAAKVPFVVALNKMDKPDINPDKVMQQLTEYSIVPEEWGGDTMFIPVSAKTGMGIDNLLERVLLLAELHEIKANPDRPAEGVVIEGELDKGRGAVATVLVQKGTLRVGDFIICGFTWCKVRAMTDYRGRRVDMAFPSMPVEITGWSDVPEVGERVQVCDEKIVKEVASLRLGEKKLEDQKQNSKISLDDFYKQMQTGIKELNLIIKGDVQGSIEALAQSLLRLSTDEVKVTVIHSAVGAITETDVMLASASTAIIIGFNVRPDVKARKHAEDENIDVRLYRVIYEAIDAVKKAMEGLLDPDFVEKYLGRAEVRQTFKTPNAGIIAGSYIIDGKMQRNASIRILRDSVIVHEGKLSSLRRFKDDAKEVVEGYECGIGIKDFNDVKEGDIIEGYILEEIARKL
ncbi:MAG: translation initiation factor IF-2 [Syntrophomonas sp.]|nr:translation initiation factor IF-2 [Syntrophomonas sp.]